MPLRPLKERIGDALDATHLQRLHEQVGQAPVLPLYKKLQDANVPANVPMEGLAPEPGKEVAMAWLEVFARFDTHVDVTNFIRTPVIFLELPSTLTERFLPIASPLTK